MFRNSSREDDNKLSSSFEKNSDSPDKAESRESEDQDLPFVDDEESSMIESRELPPATASDATSLDNRESAELEIEPVPEVSPENFDKVIMGQCYDNFFPKFVMRN